MESTGGREGLAEEHGVHRRGEELAKSPLEGEGMSVCWGGCACNVLCVGTSYPEVSNQVT